MAGAMNNWKNILNRRVRKEHQYPSDYDSVRSLSVLEFRFPRRSSSTATASPVSCLLGLARSVIWQRKETLPPLDLDLTAVRCGARWGMDMVLSLPHLWPSVTGHPSICSSIHTSTTAWGFAVLCIWWTLFSQHLPFFTIVR